MVPRSRSTRKTSSPWCSTSVAAPGVTRRWPEVRMLARSKETSSPVVRLVTISRPAYCARSRALPGEADVDAGLRAAGGRVDLDDLAAGAVGEPRHPVADVDRGAAQAGAEQRAGDQRPGDHEHRQLGGATGGSLGTRADQAGGAGSGRSDEGARAHDGPTRCRPRGSGDATSWATRRVPCSHHRPRPTPVSGSMVRLGTVTPNRSPSFHSGWRRKPRRPRRAAATSPSGPPRCRA